MHISNLYDYINENVTECDLHIIGLPLNETLNDVLLVHCIVFVILLQILCWLTPNLKSTYSHLFILLCYNLHTGICDNAFISRNDINVAIGNRGKCVALGLPNVYHSNTTNACRCTFGSVDITIANTSADSERFCLQLQSQSGYRTLNYILHHVDFIQFW